MREQTLDGLPQFRVTSACLVEKGDVITAGIEGLSEIEVRVI